MRTIESIALAAGVVAMGAACGGAPEGQGSPGRATDGADLSVAAIGLGSDLGVVRRLAANPTESASTVPQNGDVNPYGVAFVPDGFPAGGILRPGDVVVSNFNDSANAQGTGTTIVRVNPNGAPSLFFSDAQAPGFSTALGVLKGGFVLVGQVPSVDGSGVCTPGANGSQGGVGQGALLVVDRWGHLVRALTSATRLDGPWDLAVDDEGAFARVFVSNALSGTVTRLDLDVDASDVTVLAETQIASGYTHRCDSAAFVVGPTGLALDRAREVLYVASTADDALFAVDDAVDGRSDRGRGRVVVDDAVHLHGPLGLARAPDGHLLSAQGDAVDPDANHPSEIVEFTADGRFVAERSIDPAAGSAFGLALEPRGRGLRFAAVDDGQNVLDVWDIE